eukprot:4373315-Prymnesium_polylepis.2
MTAPPGCTPAHAAHASPALSACARVWRLPLRPCAPLRPSCAAFLCSASFFALPGLACARACAVCAGVACRCFLCMSPPSFSLSSAPPYAPSFLPPPPTTCARCGSLCGSLCVSRLCVGRACRRPTLSPFLLCPPTERPPRAR